MSGESGKGPQAMCPLRPSSPGTAPPWQRAEGRHTGTRVVLHPLQHSDYQEAVQSQGLRPSNPAGTGNTGRGSEQAAVGSPLGTADHVRAVLPRGCPSISAHSSLLKAAPGASAPMYLQARARGSRDQQAKYPQQEAAGAQGD